MLFNRNILNLHQKRAEPNFKNCQFLEYTRNDMADRLALIDHKFKNILNITIPAAEDVNLPINTFELITYSMGLHFINHIEYFLAKVAASLTTRGIFIANFIGGGSLRNLRLALIKAEELAKRSHAAHIVPLIAFDQIPALLNMSGFQETITDCEKIELEYKSPLALMRDLNKYGQSNCMNSISNYAISKKMLQILGSENEIFRDEVILISFIASKNKNSIKLL